MYGYTRAVAEGGGFFIRNNIIRAAPFASVRVGEI
jgi:hypothetical protein